MLRLATIALCLLPTVMHAADQPQWGRAWSRNMVSTERGLPDSFDPDSGKNVKWVAELGTQSYATPVIAGGRVLIGTNNDKPRDPRHRGDRAVLLCLNESDGKLAWQLVIPKISEELGDPFLDWKGVGFASPPTVEGDRVYTLTNRGEVVCLDLKGMANGNSGPFTDEGRHMTPRGREPIVPGPNDADILWICDLVKEVGVHTHDQVQGSILIRGGVLYVNSCNGVDGTHRKIRSPDAPSLVALDKRTGRVVGRDDLHLGPNTFHVNWCSPSLGELAGKPTIFFGGGDGVCYGLEPLGDVVSPSANPPIATLKNVWKFDPDPTGPKENVHRYVTNRRESPSVILGMPVVENGRMYLTSGGDPWWGKLRGALKCVKLDGAGDVTSSAEVWTYPLPRETCSTPAVNDGLVYVTDVGGTLHCVDAATGKSRWTHKCVGEFWASPLVADGMVYVGTRRGHFSTFAEGREKKLLSEVELDAGINGTAVAANGVLYVPTMTKLYAVALPARRD
jgi:outer membrane protein assembly factor BamB